MPRGNKVQAFLGWLFFVAMKNQNQAQRRQSKAISAPLETRLAFDKIVERFHREYLELARSPHAKASAESFAKCRTYAAHRKGLAAQLFRAAVEAVENYAGPLYTCTRHWKFTLGMMDDEESAASDAMLYAEFRSALEPVSDEQEAAAIAKLSAGG